MKMSDPAYYANEAPVSTYLHALGREQKVPVSGTFELTTRCNFNCQMCYVKNAVNEELSAKQWLHIGKEAAECGTLFLLLTGGEPLIRDDFEEIYVGLCEMGFVISINTNGSLLHKFLDVFKKYPPSRLNISLYGQSNETYKRLCRNEEFERVIDNIKLMKTHDIDVKLSCSLTPENAADLEGIINLSKDLDCIVQVASYMYPPIRRGFDAGDNPCRLSAEESAEYEIKIKQLTLAPLSFENKCKHLLEGLNASHTIENKIRCRAGTTNFWIDSNGDFSFCGMVPIKNNNVLDGFQKAWKKCNEEVQKIRIPEKCINCQYNNFCAVCPAVTLTETGTFTGVPEYVCQRNNALVQKIASI